MDDRIAAIFDGVSRSDIGRVASGAVGADVNVLGPLTYEEITTPHSEARTVAIVKVAGNADGRAWSSVVKVLDLSIRPAERLVGSTAPETEEIFYEEGYFSDAKGLRPARCYLVLRLPPALKLMWLEDLTSASGPPFSQEQLTQMSAHFGAWNGLHAGHTPQFKFPLLHNSYSYRLETWGFPAKLDYLESARQTPVVRAMFRDHSLDVARDFIEVAQQLTARLRQSPGTLAYGDCSAGNVFYRAGETIGIDWASLTLDPLGVDGGCLIGSSITWGRDFATIAGNERALFECYVAGLRSAGWNGDVADIRRGYFGQFAYYVAVTLTLAANFSGADNYLGRQFFEKRYKMPLEDIPESAARIVDLAPHFTREMRALLD